MVRDSPIVTMKCKQEVIGRRSRSLQWSKSGMEDAQEDPPVSVLTNDLFIWFFILSHFWDSRHEGVKIVFSFGCDVGGVFIWVRRKSTMLTPLLKCLCGIFVLLLCTLMVWRFCQHRFELNYSLCMVYLLEKTTKLSWCWQTHATRLEVIQGHQTWYHSIY